MNSPMMPKPGLRRAISLLACFLVIVSLLVPRLIVHRHSDLHAAQESGSAFALHVERFHGSESRPVDASEIHFHWSFSFPAGELPEGSEVDRGLMIAASPFDVDGAAFCSHGHKGEPLSGEQPSGVPAIAQVVCEIGPCSASSNFKRVFFGVWII